MVFYQTIAHQCGYLPNRNSVNIIVDPKIEITTKIYGALVDCGFRRNGKNFYRPNCPQCDQCIATRINVKEFNPNRSQKRTLKLNQDVNTRITRACFKEEHFQLYKTYLEIRHSESPMSQSTIEDYKHFIIGNWFDTRFLEIHKSNKLICMVVFDVLPQGISAVYSFYNPNYKKRSLGTLAILKLIEETINNRLSYLYLGYWIQECDKMNYKIDFKPIQGYKNKVWQDL